MSPVKIQKTESGKKGWWNCFSYDEEPEHKKKKMCVPLKQKSPKLPKQNQYPIMPLEL